MNNTGNNYLPKVAVSCLHLPLYNFDQHDINEAVDRVIQLSEYSKKSLQKVVMKVNLRYYWDSSTGETTDPRVVSAVIDSIRGRFGSNVEILVAEADASAMRAKHAFRMLGYEKLANNKSVQLVNLSEEESDEHEIDVNGKTIKLSIPSILTNVDALINIPKIKFHRLTTITCSMKNMFGALHVRRKVQYHPMLNEVIVAVNKLVKPSLNIADGLVVLGKHPVKMGLVMASTSSIALDCAVATLMGNNPKRIHHLSLAVREGLGSFNYQLKGDSLDEASQVFPKINRFLYASSWALQLRILNLYARFSGDILPPLTRSG